MIHEQWRTQVFLDVLAHEQDTATDSVDAANDALRELLEGSDAFAPGVNVIQVTAEAPIPVHASGLGAQIYQGTQFCVVYLKDQPRGSQCVHVSYVSGPFATKQLALEALAAEHPEELCEDEYGIYRDDDGLAMAQVTTIEPPHPPKRKRPGRGRRRGSTPQG